MKFSNKSFFLHIIALYFLYFNAKCLDLSPVECVSILTFLKQCLNSRDFRVGVHEIGHLLALYSDKKKLKELDSKYGIVFPSIKITKDITTNTIGSVLPEFKDKKFEKQIMLERNFSNIDTGTIKFIIRYILGGGIAEKLLFKEVCKGSLEFDAPFLQSLLKELSCRSIDKGRLDIEKIIYREIFIVYKYEKKNLWGILYFLYQLLHEQELELNESTQKVFL